MAKWTQIWSACLALIGLAWLFFTKTVPWTPKVDEIGTRILIKKPSVTPVLKKISHFPTVPKREKIQEKEKVPESPLSQLKARMERVVQQCGEVCQTSQNRTRLIGHKYYDVVVKKFNCQQLFDNNYMDGYTLFPTPPKTIPGFLRDGFTYQNRVQVRPSYRDDSKGKRHTLIWTEDEVAKLRSSLQRNELRGNYGIAQVKNIQAHLREHMNITDQHVLIVGSQFPWLEVIALEAGAKRITTLEYVPIESRHPQIKTIVPKDFALKFLNGTLGQFDAMMSFSSFEHSGLGRYGDGLNPYGDLITMARVWCVLRDGGMVLIGVPTGPDVLVFNLHRIYGPVMYSHLFANFEQVFTKANIANYHRQHCYQPIHILRKNLTLFKGAI
ncbi:hypothetical protein TCAL_01895 [Tigriopus californicus]|uniref:Uncharacterized protein n=1 Tax=Tigriopus californicus TaxID=6832 RepID=A0A553P5R3_TIGCA|nr:uncharacterized protein LOC131878356 [Tigriopus californicus]TRY73027.1 hypothetical protein TCAL_01895 [Tigriopus californicus]|eukprot:TCALIF_01895-PA protein Name:"Protein of unknown function" AED:0.00 eAED:0.00 QI:100/1/1/1/0.33/0.25/4/121/383